MPRTLISLFAASALAISGCAMCQDCQDELGPVSESENYTTQSLGDRAGSVLSGGGSPAGYVEEYVEEYVETAAEPGPTLAEPQGSSRR